MKKKFKVLNLFIAFILFPYFSTVFADEKKIHMAVGGGMSFYLVRDFGENYFTQFAPEAVVYTYVPLFKQFWLRPGIRANYSWLQPEMPKAFRIEENDLKYDIELGLVFDWIIIPSLSVGIGGNYRTTTLKTGSPIAVVEDDISESDNLLMLRTQLGIGIPIMQGLIVIEPYARYIMLQNDARYAWGYGLEVTVQIF